MKLPFGEWLPDQAVYENPGVEDARNVLPAKGGGYEPALDYLEWGTGAGLSFIPKTPYGTKWKDGTDLNLLGSNGRVSWVQKASSTDLTAAISPTTTDPWDFTTFGDFVIAVNPDQAPIKLDLSSTSNVFALVTGSPPDGAKTVGRVRDFIVLGNITESATDYPNRIRWSGFNNQDKWGSDLSTQADFSDLKLRFGGVEKIVPGSVGYIFQESAITRMSYVGPPVIFRLDTVLEDSGTISGQSIVWTDKVGFFYSQNGFQMLDLGSGNVRPIGADRIDEWFLDNVDTDEINAMSAAIDHINKRVMWAFKSDSYTGESLDRYDTVLVYDWIRDQWSYFEPGVSFHGFGSFELNGDTRDSTYVVYQWDGASRYEVGFFDGTELAGRVRTGHIGAGDQHIYVDGARPLVEVVDGANPSAISVRANYKDILYNDSAGNTGNIAVNSEGVSNFRVNARYIKFIVNITGSYRRLLGIEFDAVPRNKR